MLFLKNMLSKKVVAVLVFCAVAMSLWFVTREKEWSEITREELAEMIDVDISVINNTRSQIFRTLVKDEGAYEVYRVEVPSFYTLMNNKEKNQLLIPCYLFLHKDTKKRPGILIIPGNGQGIESTAGFVDDYENRSAAYLAKEGYIVLTCDNIGFGKYVIPLFLEYLIMSNPETAPRVVHGFNVNLPAEKLRHVFDKKSIIGTIVQDQLQALQVLKRIPTVNRIGVGGGSMGGMIAVYLAALDTDVRGVVSMGFFNRYKTLPSASHWGWYQFPDEIPEGKMLTITSLVAPRSALYVLGEKDESQSIKEGKVLFGLLNNKYTSMNAEGDISFVTHEGRHIWKNELAILFFDSILKK